MGIKRIKVSNFRSFKTLDVELGSLNVLIGANASGKSNFVQLLRFFSDISNLGLDNAVSLQGGDEYLRFIGSESSEHLEVEVTCEEPTEIRGTAVKIKRGNWVGMKPLESVCRFNLAFGARKKGLQINDDRIIHKCDFIRLEKSKGKFKDSEPLGKGEVILYRGSDGKAHIEFKLPPGLAIREEDLLPAYVRQRRLPSQVLLFYAPLLVQSSFVDLNRDMAIYDLDPKLSKRAYQITGKAELEEDGSNLALVLKKIIESKEKKRKLTNLMKDALPFVENFGIESLADKSLLFKLRESYFRDYLPASLLSDGTISIAALIVTLYFETKKLIVLEEPERNIHPHLISRLVSMMKDASQKKQIIVTSHNPMMVKYAGLENILLVTRSQAGHSTITKPIEKEHVKEFLRNDMGIEELYVQNLLELPV